MNNAMMLKTEVNEIRQKAFDNLSNGQMLLNKSYLGELKNFSLQKVEQFQEVALNLATDVRLFKLERIVLENKQSMLESMTSAYMALGSSGYTVFILLNGTSTETEVYIGVRGDPKKASASTAAAMLESAFEGHFSGSSLKQLKGYATEEIIQSLNDGTNAVTAVTGVPSLSIEEREHFMQGLEKFIDAAEGKIYQAILLAEPIGSQQLEAVRIGYERIATQLSPLLKQSISFGENESDSISLSISKGLNTSFSESLALTETRGINSSTTDTDTHGTSTTVTTGKSGKSLAGKIGAPIISAGAAIIGGALFGPPGLAAGGFLGGITSTLLSDTHSKSTAAGTSHSSSHAKTEGSSHQTGSTTTQTKQTGSSFTEQSGTQRQTGSSRQITLEETNKSIEQLLKKVDHHLERLDEARRYGAWQSAAYFISNNSADSQSLASIFLGLIRGNNSNSEDFALSTWTQDKAKKVIPWLQNLTHPRIQADFSDSLGITYLTPATLVSSKEMAIQLSLPRRSTSTVSVLEAQAFGRRVELSDAELKKVDESKEKNTFRLGRVRHLWKDLKQEVTLDINNLASHVFVAGSTGSGKSNTVYHILDQVSQKDVKFMVIEPAKGEYKHVFGHREDVTVLGTNPKHTALLRINPFKFPSEIHVLEHIDRLIEIFNVCWPMYSAMPAVLKKATLDAYENCGWDLLESSNSISQELFPSFNDLLVSLKKVIDASDYSQELKSNYTGALVTRVESLTNGLNGQIFNADEIDNNLLFDSNIIVDLSRVGAQETKALIMGILVMRLSEYRMSTSGMNQPLKHITVLEEAHNILKRTSTEQSSEGSNVMGKAVEMLSNAIAEMRTYGEGFIIADQSPNAVDISAIRNTNTKIIMRLPEDDDRQLAGKSAALDEDQIMELSKLPCGVAVVYQNNWVEAVLCKVDYFKTPGTLYQFNGVTSTHTFDKKQFNLELCNLLLYPKFDTKPEIDIALLREGAHKQLSKQHAIGLLKTLAELENTQKASIWRNANVFRILVAALNISENLNQFIENNFDQENLHLCVRNLLLEHINNVPENIFEIISTEIQTIIDNKQSKENIS